MTAYGHLAATDVRDGVSVVGESGRRIPVGHSNADRQLSLLIGRYAARTPCASVTCTPRTAAGEQLVERSAPSRAIRTSSTRCS
jgi:hypothetical protein